MVRQLSVNEKIDIANNYVLTKHSFNRLKERFTLNKQDIQNTIITSKLAYINTDDSINVQIGKSNNYYVFVKDNNKYIMVTCKEPSHNGISLYEKFKLALSGKKYLKK